MNMILDFTPRTESVILDMAEPPILQAHRECHHLGWILSQPTLSGNLYFAAITNPDNETDFRLFAEITPAKALARALEAARIERRTPEPVAVGA